MGATHSSRPWTSQPSSPLVPGPGGDAAIATTGVPRPSTFTRSRDPQGGHRCSAGIHVDEPSQVPAFELTLFQKRVQGALFGASSPSRDIPWMLRMYQAGQLLLDELITTRYTLDQINQGYEDMHAGKNIRGVINY